MEIRVRVPTKLPICNMFDYTPKVLRVPSVLGGRGKKKKCTAIKILLPNTSSAYLSTIGREIQRQIKLLFFVLDRPQKSLRHNLLSLFHTLPEPRVSTATPKAGLLEPAPCFLSLPPQSRLVSCWVQTGRYWAKYNIPFLAVEQRGQLRNKKSELLRNVRVFLVISSNDRGTAHRQRSKRAQCHWGSGNFKTMSFQKLGLLFFNRRTTKSSAPFFGNTL